MSDQEIDYEETTSSGSHRQPDQHQHQQHHHHHHHHTNYHHQHQYRQNDSFRAGFKTASTPSQPNRQQQHQKYPQVYSTYIQSDHEPKPNPNKFGESPRAQKPRAQKRPKLDELTSSSSTLNRTVENTNPAIDTLISSFLGLDTFNHANLNFDLIDRDVAIVALSPQSTKENICFKGKCSIALLCGEVEINAFKLKSDLENSVFDAKWLDLFSPETNGFLSILNRQTELVNLDSQKVGFLINRLKLCLAGEVSQEITLKLTAFFSRFTSGSIFLLRAFNSQVCNYFGYFKNFQHVYQTAQRDVTEPADSKMARLGLFPVQEKFFNAVHVINDEEREIFRQFEPKNTEKTESVRGPVVMACGGKDVGKSTFLRCLVNSLLNHYPKVAYIDCDPGQCEFTISGCITLSLVSEPLLGPPHTHISHCGQSKRCYFLGHISPSDAPGHYLDCVRQCSADFAGFTSMRNENIPLIVNTMGWNQGLGLCLLKEKILLFKPTHIIQLNHPVDANKNMPVLDKTWLRNTDGYPSTRGVEKAAESQNVPIDAAMEKTVVNKDSLIADYKLVSLKSGAPYKAAKFEANSAQKRFAPKDHRNLAVLAYFVKLQEPKLYFKPVHYLRPYRVAWCKFALHVTHTRVDYDQLLRVFNASLVGLCLIQPKYIKRKYNNPQLPGYIQSFDPSSNSHVVYQCLGFGIIRGINMETKEFYILTPEPFEVLEQVNLLTKGMLNLPLEFFFEQDYETSCPYMSFSDNFRQTSVTNDQSGTVGTEPLQRKYLIHQQQNQSKISPQPKFF